MALTTRQIVGAALLLAGLAAAAWGQEAPRIEQRDQKFHPSAVELKRGQTLLVTNEDPFIHHVYVETPQFNYDSGEQRPGRTLSINFNKPGDFVLQCAIHLKMKLKVAVRPD